ncbi:MAG: LptF/LptG family permease, partial [Pseudomonadota bacterium]
LSYRPRGEDARELLLHELFAESRSPDAALIEPAAAGAAFHNRLGRSLLLLILPLSAAALGLGQGRMFQSGGVAVGVAFLVLIQKLLESGESLAAAGAIAPWAGTWPVIGTITAVSAWLFYRAAQTVSPPPLIAVSQAFSALVKRGA